MPAPTAPDDVVGVRHARANRPCLCGCQHVVGLTGHVVRDADTPKLARLDPPTLIAEFDVPSPAGGPTRPEQVAYTYAELGLDRPVVALVVGARVHGRSGPRWPGAVVAVSPNPWHDFVYEIQWDHGHVSSERHANLTELPS